jgi:1,2-diacylglycerol 3-alpha-glucosyltransferase
VRNIKSAGIIFHKFGPYHITRINALNKFISATAFELSAISKEYKWDEIKDAQSFKRVVVFGNTNSRDVSANILKKELFKKLNENPVEVMLINGWGDKGGLLALKWCLQRNIPTIVMTEEVADTFERKFWKEYPKKKIVQLFDAALVGGKPHVAYMKQLGMPAELIETGYDAVDNYYFKLEAEKVRSNQEFFRKKYQLPQHFFLTSNRFIEKKNLFRLLEAYRKYLDLNQEKSWQLIMLGDGTLKKQLQEKMELLKLTDHVQMPGFLQYDALPHYYGLANVFIHSSTSEQWGLVVNEAMASGLPVIVSDKCGCCKDLVENGVNGFSFDPYNVEELSEKMGMVNKKSVAELYQMGEESQRIIAKFAPENFGNAANKCVEKINIAKPRSKPLLNKIILSLTVFLFPNK